MPHSTSIILNSSLFKSLKSSVHLACGAVRQTFYAYTLDGAQDAASGEIIETGALCADFTGAINTSIFATARYGLYTLKVFPHCSFAIVGEAFARNIERAIVDDLRIEGFTYAVGWCDSLAHDILQLVAKVYTQSVDKQETFRKDGCV